MVDDPPLGVLAIDPVALVNSGVEAPGDEKIFLRRHGWEYRFLSVENKAEFERRPERYEPAQGGACGRMGPLSGYGRGGIYALHEGRLWLFASESCKSRFLSAPNLHIDPDAPRPKGQKSVARLLAAIGGQSWLDADIAYERFERVRQGGRLYRNATTLSWTAQGDVRQSEAWDDQVWTYSASGERGSYRSPTDEFDLALTQVRALRRSLARTPIGLVRAMASGQAVIASESQLEMTVWADGAMIRVGLDSQSRPESMEFEGWDAQLHVGPVLIDQIQWAEVKGLNLPIAWRERRGDAGPELRTWTRVRVRLASC